MNVLHEMDSVLHVPYLTTVVLQKNDFTLSDFYGCFQIIELRLNKIIESPQPKTTNLAQLLLQCVNKRKSKLIETPLMICAVYLDPRYKCIIELDHEKIQLAKMTIEHIWNRLTSVKGIVSKKKDKPIAKKDNMDTFYAELDLHLNLSLCLQSSTGMESSSTVDSKCAVINAISKYESKISGTRMQSNKSIHEYWENEKEEFGVLYEVACIVFAIPPTQASVERNFSALKYMLTDKRYNLKPELLESLLLIHLNRTFFFEIRSKEILNV